MLSPPNLLLEGGVDLWYLFTENLPLAPYYALLSEEERAEVEAVRHPLTHDLMVLGRALTRLVLSEYAPLEPSQWSILRSPYGKPYVDPKQPALYFNIAHTEGLVICGVSEKGAIGVDVERTDRGGANIHAWTAKEAIAKGLGYGVSLPFENILQESPTLYRVLLTPPLSSADPLLWYVLRPTISPLYSLAIATPCEPHSRT
jgi:4'-phosphopantetheinyl transferase